MRKCARTILILAALSLASISAAQTQAPDLDELQRQLDAAKAQEARAAEAARREAAARAAQKARMATLVIRADAACDLRIDGESKGRLTPDAPRTLEVIGGKQLIECVSTEESSASVETIAEVAAGTKDILTLDIAGKVNSARAERERERQAQIASQQQREREAEAARQAEAQRQQAAQARQTYLARWTDQGNGVLRDTSTGLEWAQKDNGSDIDWKKAMRYCNGLKLDGRDWRLPTQEELLAIYKDDLTEGGARCGSYDCRVSPRFNLSSWWFWTSTQDGSSSASLVLLLDGSRLSLSVSVSYGTFRALCVRRRS